MVTPGMARVRPGSHGILVSEISSPQAILGDATLEESRFGPLTTVGDIATRCYPFPYRAAFTISNDCDSMSRAPFEDWHAFVNGRGPTPNGDGLGLEIDDSFWIWAGQRKNVLSLHQQFPEQQPRVDSADVGRIAELGRLGWLRTLHSMGNWRRGKERGQSLHAAREQAAYALDRLSQLGINASTYVNHSGSISNIGGPWGWYQGADDPDHPFYCLDLMRAYGLKYFWLDTCINIEKFGDHLHYSTRSELLRAIERYEWAHWLRRRDDQLNVEPMPLPEDRAARRRLLLSLFNRTLLPVKARDNTPIFAFKRFRGMEQPVMSSFCTQVTERDLDDLEARRGVAIVYQHFGIVGPRGRAPALSRRQRQFSGPPVFDEHARSRMINIAERFRAGRLWVATTARILDYLWLRDALRFAVEKSAGRWIVTLDRLECATLGHRDIGNEDLNGLSFAVPPDAPDVTVVIRGRAQPLPMHRVADPAWPNMHAVYLPWQPLEWPQ